MPRGRPVTPAGPPRSAARPRARVPGPGWPHSGGLRGPCIGPPQSRWGPSSLSTRQAARPPRSAGTWSCPAAGFRRAQPWCATTAARAPPAHRRGPRTRAGCTAQLARADRPAPHGRHAPGARATGPCARPPLPPPTGCTPRAPCDRPRVPPDPSAPPSGHRPAPHTSGARLGPEQQAQPPWRIELRAHGVRPPRPVEPRMLGWPLAPLEPRPLRRTRSTRGCWAACLPRRHHPPRRSKEHWR
jgi:hypothetical protein